LLCIRAISTYFTIPRQVAARLKDNALLARIAAAVSAASPAGLAIAQIRERLGGS
jgi:hypothetical protein